MSHPPHPAAPTRRPTWARLGAWALAGLVCRATAAPDALTLGLPVDCEMGRVCSIQKYVDHDPGPGRVDYACGRLSGDGDTGTDFRVPDVATMEQGVAVVAAADGAVHASRDGMPDVNVGELPPGALRGREAGNGVVLDHGDGWRTQYSHLKRGSVVVRPGDQVRAGQRLGLIGLSGNTEFPHVEFSVRFRGTSVDPFVGRVPFDDCHDARTPLWSAAALTALPYAPSGPLTTGFAADRPEATTARRGGYATGTLPADAPALVLWADVYGVQRGDVQRFEIRDPKGRTVHAGKRALDAGYLAWFAFSGLERPATGWAPGTYTGRHALVRDGLTLFASTATVRIGREP